MSFAHDTKSLRWFRFPLRRLAPVPQVDEASARRVMPVLPESSSTNPHDHRPGHEDSSFWLVLNASNRERWPTFAPVRPPRPVLAVLISVTFMLTGCLTGKRPSLADDPFQPGSSSGNAAIDQVLAELDRLNVGPYTAGYSVLTRYGNTNRPATVAIDGARRSVTIGDVRFLTFDNGSQTCLLDTTQPCSSSIDPARVSDTQITPSFYAADAAKRLRRDATSMVGPPLSHVENIAGQSALCVDVPLPGGTSVFCTLIGGPLARLDDAAVSIDLQTFALVVDETAFATGR